MDEIIGQMEQPTQNAAESETIDAAKEVGSMYGKFKDATSLLNAYKNLEAEFTRKSQRVAQLEKIAMENSKEVASRKCDALEEDKNESVPSENATNEFSDKEKWQKSVNEFFSNNPEATEYKSRMSRILHENPEYMKSPKCLDLAFKLARAEGLKRPADIIKDQKFIERTVA